MPKFKTKSVSDGFALLPEVIRSFYKTEKGTILKILGDQDSREVFFASGSDLWTCDKSGVWHWEVIYMGI